MSIIYSLTELYLYLLQSSVIYKYLLTIYLRLRSDVSFCWMNTAVIDCQSWYETTSSSHNPVITVPLFIFVSFKLLFWHLAEWENWQQNTYFSNSVPHLTDNFYSFHARLMFDLELGCTSLRETELHTTPFKCWCSVNAVTPFSTIMEGTISHIRVFVE